MSKTLLVTQEPNKSLFPDSHSLLIWRKAMSAYYACEYDNGLKYFDKLLDKYNLVSYSILGIYFEFGLGSLNFDYEKAKSYFIESLPNNSSEGVLGLSRLYRQGKGVEKSYKKSFKLLKKYSEKFQDSNLWFFLGLHYENGDGTKKNIDKAIECYKKSKNVYAYFRLNYIYCKTLNEDDFKYINCFKAIPYKFKYWFYKKMIKRKNPYDERLRETI